MTATERVLAALAYQPVDRIPLFDSYWGEFVAAWQQQKRLGPDVDINDYYGIDIAICTPDETPWPSQAATLERTPAGEVARDGWGATHRTTPGSFFYEEVAVALPEKVDPDTLVLNRHTPRAAMMVTWPPWRTRGRRGAVSSPRPAVPTCGR